MISFQVRPATLRDAAAVAQVHAESARAAYQDLVPAEALQATSNDKRQAYWREAIEYGEPQVQLLLVDARVVGFVGFDRSRDPKSKPTVGELWALYLLPEFWGQGGAVELWDAARQGLLEEGCTSVTVWVPLRNERALRFFELAGFKRENNTARTAVVAGVKLEELRLKRALD